MTGNPMIPSYLESKNGYYPLPDDHPFKMPLEERQKLELYLEPRSGAADECSGVSSYTTKDGRVSGGLLDGELSDHH